MVRKLRIKFVITAMSALMVILIATMAIINVVNVYEFIKSADQVLAILVDNDGSFPSVSRKNDDATMAISSNGEALDAPPDVPQIGGDEAFEIRNMEMPFSTRYFWVKMDSTGEISQIDTGHIAAVSSTEASNLAKSVYAKNATKGFISTYRYMVKENSGGDILIVFKDCSSDIYDAVRLFRNLLLIMGACLVSMFVLVYFMSAFAVTPIVESLEKQKRFITDAGHELKTPLAVISANIDVIELENGKSEWTSSVKNQVSRMTNLVKNMLTLSRMEEENIRVVFSDIDLSKILKDTAVSFEAVAQSMNKKYTIDIQDDVHINGDKNSMVQLASLLIDNAMKYSSKEGNISVRMSRDKQVVFEVNNTCDNIPEGNLDRLFDRFYRADTSRNRKSGGYGIGLSVARAIATTYGGTIEALRDGDKTIRFVVKLPKGGAKAKKSK